MVYHYASPLLESCIFLHAVIHDFNAHTACVCFCTKTYLNHTSTEITLTSVVICQLLVVENVQENDLLKAFGALNAAAKHAGFLRMATGHSGKRRKSLR